MIPVKEKNKSSNKRIIAIALAALLLLFTIVAGGKAQAAGLLIADGGFGGVLEIKSHEVKVTINNGVAVTHVTQVFHNTEKRQVEALYTFPVPKGASVANFSMWINGKEMVGEVLEKERAREIYNSYKQQRRDPGLLEQVDYKTFEMRIYPINPEADQKVQITYYQELEVDHDYATYVYPLATVTRENVDSRTTGKFAIDVEMKSAIPITNVESPSHGEEFVMAAHSENFHQASLETAGGSLARDVVIGCQLSRPKTGLDLITSRRKGEDGFFYLTLTAGKELAKLDEGMDYVFLLDISGSMGNDSKLIISKNSLYAFVDELAPDDRFEVMSFNVAPDTAFGNLQSVSPQTKEQAKTFMQSKSARGGTTLAPAMTTAYKYGDPDRVLNVVILSDGMTEQRERQALMQLITERPRNSRVFCIGVGNEVNRPLLEQMAEESGGLAAFVSRGDNFKRQAKAFRRKLLRPAATDISIAMDGVRVFDVEPVRLPSLYHGAPIRIYGRYSGSGEAVVNCKANVQGVELDQSVRLNFPEVDTENPEIERMWALKRVDRLLKSADRDGSRQAVIDEIVQLGETFSIVTEYTSFLVLENDAEYRRWKIERRNLDRLSRDRNAQERKNEALERIRASAMDSIGPQAVEKKKWVAQAPVKKNTTPAANPIPVPSAQPSSQPSNQSRDFNFTRSSGSGPVGPLFAAAAFWLYRRKRRK